MLLPVFKRHFSLLNFCAAYFEPQLSSTLSSQLGSDRIGSDRIGLDRIGSAHLVESSHVRCVGVGVNVDAGAALLGLAWLG